jgi:hypothetical protein
MTQSRSTKDNQWAKKFLCFHTISNNHARTSTFPFLDFLERVPITPTLWQGTKLSVLSPTLGVCAVLQHFIAYYPVVCFLLARPTTGRNGIAKVSCSWRKETSRIFFEQVPHVTSGFSS